MKRTYLEEIKRKIKCDYPIIQIVSYERRRILGAIVKSVKDTNKDIYIWNNVDGIQKFNIDERTYEEIDKDKIEPIEAIKWFIDKFSNDSQELVFIMEDLHLYFDSPQKRQIITLLKKISNIQGKRSLILSQPIKEIPLELEKDIYVVEIPLPDTKVLKAVIREAINITGIDFDLAPEEDFDDIAEAALGLTEMEAKYTFLEIIKFEGKLTKQEIPLIIEKKEQIIKKSGILEYFHPQESFKDVGGLENLKKWLKVRKLGFNPKAKDFGLSVPKGVLLFGVQGCGKSLLAKAISAEWNLPLLKLDIGRIFGSLVGESESNLRKAIAIAEAISPCILWIDEIEKGFSGLESSGNSDGGTTARVFGTMLTWMQEKEKPVFIVATANNIENLPPEFLRKGRFDEIFFVDLPGKTSRKEIWEIHLRKKLGNRYEKLINKGIIDLDKLTDISKGYTGAEIEEAINESLYIAYYEDREIKQEDLEKSIESIYPLSKVMGDIIEELRKWAEIRVKKASNEEVEQINWKNDNKTPKLKKEMINPFI